MAIFGANFVFQKFCPCKKNDKYEVWCRWIDSASSTAIIRRHVKTHTDESLLYIYDHASPSSSLLTKTQSNHPYHRACKHLLPLIAAIIAIERKQLGLQNSLFVSTIIKHWKGIKHVHGDFLHISDFKVLIISLFVPVGK